MSNATTREAKVRIGFDIDTATAQKGFENNAKAAEKLEKAIDKVGGRYKQVKEEFATNKAAAITGTLGAITRAATGVSDEVGRMLAGFGVVANVVQMFGALNGSIQNSVKSLKELRSVGGTLTQLQGLHYAGGAGVGAAGVAGATAGAAARTGGSTVLGAAAGGAIVSAAGQFATSQAATQVKDAVDKAVDKLGDKVTTRADKIFDSVIDSIVTKKKPGSSLAPFTNGGAVGAARKSNGWDGDVFDTTWRYNTPRTPLMIGRDQTLGEYVKDAMMNSATSPSMGKPSAFSRFLYNAQTEFGSPKNRMHVFGGAAIGATVGGIAGYGLGGGEGAGLGAGLGAVAGGAGNLIAGGGISKAAIASLANPLGLALAGVAVTAASVLLVKGGEKGDKVADTIAGWYLSIFDDGAAKAQKKLDAKIAERTRRETVAQAQIGISSARQQALDSLYTPQIEMRLQQEQLRKGSMGAGLDVAIEFGSQNLTEANQRLIAAQTAKFRGIDLGRGGNSSSLISAENQALNEFQLQFASQRQLTDTRAAGQMATISPQIDLAQSQLSGAIRQRDLITSRRNLVSQGKLKSGELGAGFTDADMIESYRQVEVSANKLLELERQRGQIQKSTLETQKQEYAVIREQVRAREQAARAALSEKESTIEQAQKEFAMMNDSGRQFSVDIAKQLREKGVASLTDEQKQFASGKALFSQLMSPGELAQAAIKDFGLNNSDFRLTTQPEADALKAAQSVKVAIEQEIAANLQLDENKLADALAARIGPILKTLEINTITKYNDLQRQTEQKLSEQKNFNQAGNMSNLPPR